MVQPAVSTPESSHDAPECESASLGLATPGSSWPAPEDLEQDSFLSFLRWVTHRKGIVFNSYKFLKSELQNRFEGHMHSLHIPIGAYRQYAGRLMADEGSAGSLWQAMDSLLAIDISRFFRDGQMWQFLLSSVFPPLIALCGGGPFRVWVMGAANGEEVAFILCLSLLVLAPARPEH